MCALARNDHFFDSLERQPDGLPLIPYMLPGSQRAAPNGLAANSRCEFVWSRCARARIGHQPTGLMHFIFESVGEQKIKPILVDRSFVRHPERTRCRSALADLYGAAGALPGRKPATGRFHLIIRVRRGAKNKTHPDGWVLFFGDPERTRTVDLQRDRLAC